MPAIILLEPFMDVLIEKVEKNPKFNGYISTIEFKFLDHILCNE